MTVLLPQQYWAFQLYVMLLPSHSNDVAASHSLLTLSTALLLTSIKIQLEYTYQINSGTNSLQLLITKTLATDGNKLDIPLGEWLFLSLYSTASDHILDVQGYGHSKIEGVTTLGILSMALGLKSPDLIIYMRELLVWNENIALNSLITDHTCQLSHPSGFLPYAQLDLDFDVDSTSSQLVDVVGSITSLGLSLLGVLTPASLIETYQPVAVFSTSSFLANSTGLPACGECTPSCAVCSDLFSCSSCESGIEINGICFTHSINAISGDALSSNFSLDLSDFSNINIHTNIQLIQPSSLPTVFSSRAFLRYPNSSQFTLPDPSSFSVPRYQAVGLSQFQTQLFLQYVINGRSYITKMADLLIDQLPFSPAEVLVNAIQNNQSLQNDCRCSVFGTCSLTTGRCECSEGHAGIFCNYEAISLQDFRNQVAAMVDSLALGNLTFLQILKEMLQISKEPSGLRKVTTLTLLGIIQGKVSPLTPVEEIELIFQILSNLSVKPTHELDSDIEVTQALLAIVSSVELNFVEQEVNIEISSPQIVLKVQTIDLSLPHVVWPSSDSSTELQLPGELLPSSGVLSTVYFEQHLYEGVSPASSIQISPSLSVNIFEDKVLRKFTDLEVPIILRFEVDPDFPVHKRYIEDIEKGTRAPETVSCHYYDPLTKSVSEEGCELVEVSEAFITCQCSHLTDFMSFLKTGETVITSSNYDVFSSVSDFSYKSLMSNLGVHIAIGYWTSYLIFVTIVASIDRAKMRRGFFTSLFQVVRDSQSPPQNKTHNQIFYNLKTESSEKQSPSKSSKVLPMGRDSYGSSSQLRQMFNPSESKPAEDEAHQSIILEDYSESFHDKRKKKPKIPRFRPVKTVGINTDPQLVLSAPDWKHLESYSLSMLIRIRINSILGSEYYKKSCFCAFQKLARSELEANNQIYNLFAKTSPLNKRALRLSLFYLALLLEVSMVALFYDLYPSSESSAPLFWEGIIQNFWVSLYSVVFALAPLLLVGLLFSVPKKWMGRIKQAQGVAEVEQIYQEIKCRIRARVISGIILFILLSCILLLFIIAFCEVASSSVASDWIVSSVIAIAIDQLVFEMLPAIAIACFGVVKGFCRGCSGLLSVMIAIEIYRIYKNLVLG